MLSLVLVSSLFYRLSCTKCSSVLVSPLFYYLSCPVVFSVISPDVPTGLLFVLSIDSIICPGFLLDYHLSWCPLCSVICPGIPSALSTVLVSLLFFVPFALTFTCFPNCLLGVSVFSIICPCPCPLCSLYHLLIVVCHTCRTKQNITANKKQSKTKELKNKNPNQNKQQDPKDRSYHWGGILSLKGCHFETCGIVPP